MARLEQKVENIETTVQDVKKMMTDFIKASDEKYATKESSWAEGALRIIAYAVIGAVIAGLLALLGLKTYL